MRTTICVIVFLTLFSACSYINDDPENVAIAKNTSDSDLASFDDSTQICEGYYFPANNELVEQGYIVEQYPFFNLYLKDHSINNTNMRAANSFYVLYDKNGAIVLEKEAGISGVDYSINDSYISIGIPGGTGVYINLFYDYNQNILSKYYSDVVLVESRQIVYGDYDFSNPDNKKVYLVTHDIFDDAINYAKLFLPNYATTINFTTPAVSTEIHDNIIIFTYLSTKQNETIENAVKKRYI